MTLMVRELGTDGIKLTPHGSKGGTLRATSDPKGQVLFPQECLILGANWRKDFRRTSRKEVGLKFPFFSSFPILHSQRAEGLLTEV